MVLILISFLLVAIDRARLRKELNIENEKMILCVGRLDKPKRLS